MKTLQSFQKQVQYTFQDPRTLETALIHKSYGNEQRTTLPAASRDNEQLEFLGDAVLDLAISELLLELYPNFPEGDLSKLRASLVNERTLAEVARTMKLGDFILLGKGEELTGGKDKDSILSGVLEAVLAAIYRDGGFTCAMEWVKSRFRDHAVKAGSGDQASRGVHMQDYKTKLQEVSQALYRTAPRYEVVSSDGPDHEKLFVIKLSINGAELSRGEGRSKKEAEQSAAKKAFDTYGAQLSHPSLKKK